MQIPCQIPIGKCCAIYPIPHYYCIFFGTRLSYANTVPMLYYAKMAERLIGMIFALGAGLAGGGGVKSVARVGGYGAIGAM